MVRHADIAYDNVRGESGKLAEGRFHRVSATHFGAAAFKKALNDCDRVFLIVHDQYFDPGQVGLKSLLVEPCTTFEPGFDRFIARGLQRKRDNKGGTFP